jgi:hypothetical protein
VQCLYNQLIPYFWMNRSEMAPVIVVSDTEHQDTLGYARIRGRLTEGSVDENRQRATYLTSKFTELSCALSSLVRTRYLFNGVLTHPKVLIRDCVQTRFYRESLRGSRR